MRKKIKLIMEFSVFSLVLVIGILIAMIESKRIPQSTNGFNFVTVSNEYEAYTEIYEEDYQNKIHEQVEELKKSYIYEMENPLLIADPYNTIRNGVYVYFETKEEEKVQYTVSCKGYKDFTRIVYSDDDSISKKHEWQIIGLIPEQKNTVTISTLNKENEVQKTVTFTYECPKAVSEYNVTQLEVEKGESTQELSDGLYAVLGNQYENGDNEQSQSYIGIYDNDGVLRCEIPCVSYKANRLLMDENGMYFSVTGGRICRMDNTGYVNRVYKFGSYELHHDYIFGGNNDLLVLGSDKETGTQEDLIFSIDLDTKKLNVIVDLRNIFSNYYNMTEKPKDVELLDWMHINSLTLLDKGSIVISARETSTLIKLDNIYTEPTVDYMIGSDNFWNGTGYENLLLNKVGDFSLQSGQHTITYVKDDSLEEGQYYLTMYNNNNNNTVSTTRPDYDWTQDDNYNNENINNKMNGAGSFYYKYLVDENTREFSLVNEIEVDYSSYVSSTQEYKGNTIIASGMTFTGYEFDSDNKLIQKMKFVGDILIYRVYKYDFIGYWFGE